MFQARLLTSRVGSKVQKCHWPSLTSTFCARRDSFIPISIPAIFLRSGAEITLYFSGPITMFKAKLHNLVELSQEGRNDARHVEILRLCIPVFLRAQLRSGIVWLVPKFGDRLGFCRRLPFFVG